MNLNQLATAFGFLTISLLSASPSFAAAQDGVKCPAGFETEFSQSSGVLRCKKERKETRPTVCNPAFPLHSVYKVRKDKLDRCAPVSVDVLFIGEISLDTENKTKPVTCVGLATDNPPWVIKKDGGQGSRDICERTIVEYRYPDQR